MLKVLVVFATIVGGVYASAVFAAESTALRTPSANVSINRCTLAKIATAQESKCQRASYSSLSAEERSDLDATLALTGGGAQPSGACHMWPGGWSCAGNGKLCTCMHAASGPNCICSSTN